MIKRRKPVNKVSDRQRKRLKEYRETKKHVLNHQAYCRVCLDNLATEVHHSRGRLGSLLCNETYLIPICMGCHRWIHDNVGEAVRRGWIDKQNWGKP